MNLLQMSISGAILILVVVVIRAVAINRLPKKTFLVLWCVVLLRLLLPFSIPSVFSVYSLIGQNTAINHLGQTTISDFLPIIQEEPLELAGEMSSVPTIHVFLRLVIWLVGMVFCTAFFAISYLRCCFKFSMSLPVQNDFVKKWLKEHRLKRPISIRQSDRISAPLTYGIFKPVILMPQTTDWENIKQLQYVLLHEYVHIRRFDTITKLISTVALCVHWFNPSVWAMYILFNRDIELACDESVVRTFGKVSKKDYSLMLISMEAKKSGLLPFCNNFSKNAIEERITAIMKIRKTTIFSLAAACVIVLGTMTVFATSAYDNSDSQNVATEEISDSSFDYSVYEKCGLFYDQENDYYTYQGNIVRFFYDSVAGASFTNFYTGTVDLEAEYDENNQLVGIKECSEEVYNMHTKKYENSGIASMTSETAMETGNKADTAELLKDYEPYGITYHSEEGAWYYDNQQIGVFIDNDKSYVYFDDNGELYLALCFPKIQKNEPELKEITLQEAQTILQDNNPNNVVNETTKEETIKGEAIKGEATTVFSGNSNNIPDKEYVSAGIEWNRTNNAWFYNGKLVAALYDHNGGIYTCDIKTKSREGVTYIEVMRNKNGAIKEVHEVTKDKIEELISEK